MKKDGKPTKKKGEMWVVCTGACASKKIALYAYRDSRSKTVAEELLNGYTGVVQTDGLQSYGSGNYENAGCWVHARMKFFDCIPEGDTTCPSAQSVALIDKASAYERETKKAEYTGKQILEMRQEKVKQLLDKVYEIINADVRCSSDSTWFGGGGGLCFNHVIPEGEIAEVWGSKSFSFSMCSNGNTDMTVNFDGKLTVTDDAAANTTKEVRAIFNDTYIEFQDWWKSSTKDEKSADVAVTYNTITLYYEYPETQLTNVRGDANNDGEFNVADLVLFQKWILAVPDTELKNWQVVDFCVDENLYVFNLCLMKRNPTNS